MIWAVILYFIIGGLVALGLLARGQGWADVLLAIVLWPLAIAFS